MTLADGVILFVLILSAGMGLARGFAREVIGLVGLVVGLLLAGVLAPGLGGSVFGMIPPPLGAAAAFVVVFLAVLVASALIGKLVTAALEAASLSFPNRLLGALFGLARAGLFLLAVLVALDFLGVDAGAWLRGSRLGEPAWFAARRVRKAVSKVPAGQLETPPEPPKSRTI